MRYIFVVIIVIANFGLLNCIIACIVEEVSHVTEKLREVENLTSGLMERDFLTEIFRDARSDKKGERRLGAYVWNEEGIDEKAFKELTSQPENVEKLSALGLSRLEVESIFEIIDADGSGIISEHEFVDGLMKSKAPMRCKDVHFTHAMVSGLHCKVSKLIQRAKIMGEMLDNCLDALNMVADAFDKRAIVKAEAIKRLAEYKSRTALREEMLNKNAQNRIEILTFYQNFAQISTFLTSSTEIVFRFRFLLQRNGGREQRDKAKAALQMRKECLKTIENIEPKLKKNNQNRDKIMFLQQHFVQI